MGQCKNCKWWDEKSFKNLHPEYNQNDLATYEWYPRIARCCKNPNLGEFCNREFGDGEIITTPDFGCILWKTKTNKNGG